MQNKSSVGICTRCTHVFYTLCSDLHAQSVLINKISASELRRKLVKSALLVGKNNAISALPRYFSTKNIVLCGQDGTGGGREEEKILVVLIALADAQPILVLHRCTLSGVSNGVDIGVALTRFSCH